MIQNINDVKGNLKAKGEDILVTNMYFGEEKTKSGLIITNDDGKERGIRARWCQVYSIGEDSKIKDDIKVGDWIMLEHGRWGRGVSIEDNEGVQWVIRRGDPKGVLLIHDDVPADVQGWLEHNKEIRELDKEALVKL